MPTASHRTYIHSLSLPRSRTGSESGERRALWEDAAIDRIVIRSTSSLVWTSPVYLALVDVFEKKRTTVSV